MCWPKCHFISPCVCVAHLSINRNTSVSLYWRSGLSFHTQGPTIAYATEQNILKNRHFIKPLRSNLLAMFHKVEQFVGRSLSSRDKILACDLQTTTASFYKQS